MSSIDHLQINPRIITAAKRAGLHNGKSVLTLSGAELERLTGLTAVDVTQLKDAVSQSVLRNQSITGLQMWKEECDEQGKSPRLSTGCEHLDKALRGGVLLKGITEVVGESAAGKTQLCLQLCLTVQLPRSLKGLGGGAMYICTEGAFPNKRLNQMARHFSRRYAPVLKHNVMDRIFVEHVADFDALRVCLEKKVPLALARGNVKLVVLDSVAALFRCHYDGQNLVGRAKHLASLAMQLRQLSDQYSTAVVCVNQVSANMSKSSDSAVQSNNNVPALGLVWADHVTCRLMMSRREYTASQDFSAHMDMAEGERMEVIGPGGLVSHRCLEVVFAPHLQPVVVPLIVQDSGVRYGGTDAQHFGTVHG